MAAQNHTHSVSIVHPEAQLKRLGPNGSLFVGDLDFSWCFVVYREIPGCPGYQAGSDGSIWSCWRFRGMGYAGPCTQAMSDKWKRLKGDPRKEDGRLRYTVRRADGTYRRAYGSHLVLEAFIGPKPNGMEACHNNGCCTDDSLANLRWDTPESNRKDMVRHGTANRGGAYSQAKLSAVQVIEIRRKYADGGVTQSELGVEYGVSRRAISALITGQNWKHILPKED